MVNIRKMLVSSSKYGVKCPYLMSPVGICVHNTANDASANNEVSYMINNGAEVSFHYAVDEMEIVQGLPLDRNAWAAGDGGNGQGNRKYIHIEICYSKSGGHKFDKSEENAADLVVYLLKKYGWGIDKVKKHQDFSGKYCPHRTLDKGWQRFLDLVKSKLNPTTKPPQTNDLCRILVNGKSVIALTGLQKCIDHVKANHPKDEVKIQRVSDNDMLWTQAKYVAPPKPTSNEKRYAENGRFYFNTTVTIRTAPEENARTNVNYYPGESVIYHHVILNKNGHNWIEYTRGNGTVGYLKIKNLSTGESYGYAK